MRKILLASSSRLKGETFFSHMLVPFEAHLKTMNASYDAPLIFIPWAKSDPYSYADRAKEAFSVVNHPLRSIHEYKDPKEAIRTAAAVIVGGGNTFVLINKLHKTGVLPILAARIEKGMPFLGASAGSNIACPTICTTNDMPIVEPPSFKALNIVPFQINPHYPLTEYHLPSESRDLRLKRYMEHNERAVLGLTNDCWLQIEGDKMLLKGEGESALFLPKKEKELVSAGTDLSYLLKRKQ